MAMTATATPKQPVTYTLFESYRVYRRAHSERGWSPWHDPASTPPSFVSEPFD